MSGFTLGSRIEPVTRSFVDNLEFTYQGRMIGEFNLGYLKIADFYLRAVKNVIKLSARCAAGVRGLSVAVGIF